ncbi:hypothetical protein [Streptomyces sp. NPDC090025]|uniref:hypothetical protein n=1 Tax=Streptomyces sp. NPDC090025 TaxID=3365922 RepID=UPI00383344FE
MLTTEVEFELPKGYVDAAGDLHRHGVMRLATAADEIYPLKDPRVRNWPAYLIVIVLARVVTRLGTVPDVNPKVIEGLFSEDLAHLQRLYNRINGLAESEVLVRCPGCGAEHLAEVAPLGG